MTAEFISLPTKPYKLGNIKLLTPSGCYVQTSLGVEDGKIVKPRDGFETVALSGQLVTPLFSDMHTHLDKGHIWPRQPNPNGTFDGALMSVGTDRVANWSAADVRKRMQFALRCAYAHGTGAIRTHLDSIAPQNEISWPVFREIREEWSAKIDLQASCLVPIDAVENGGDFRNTADIVKQSRGVLGAVTYPMDDLENRLETFFKMAEERNLSADFHVDETGDPSVATLRTIAETVLRIGYQGPVVVGHCCSLAVQDESEADKTMDLVAEAGVNVVSLPMCNLYLQGRDAGKTPRWRGVTLVHEMKKRGINVSFASDNTRDPFYAFGDLDMLEVMREATRIAHLDHNGDDWARAFTSNPRQACGFPTTEFAVGDSADFVIFNARSTNELLARPQSDRMVIRNGAAIDKTLPDYSELDDLMET